jgi:hypothetical protein
VNAPAFADPPSREVIDGASLRAWRRRQGLTRVQCEAALGVNRWSIQQWEDGNRREGGLPDWLRRLCAYYERHGPI